jgi:hypothetical protein
MCSMVRPMFLVRREQIKGQPDCDQTGGKCKLHESFWKMENMNLFTCENCQKTYGQKKKEKQTKLEVQV